MEVASAELKSGGNTIVSIARANAFNKDLEIHIGKAVSVREMSVFCRQFESVLNAGVTVVEALDMLSEQTENKPFANAIAEVRDSVQRGETLAVAMAEHPKIFPNLMVQMVASGGLDKAFSRVGSQFEKEAHLKGLIIKSAIYPVILILVIIVVVAIRLCLPLLPSLTKSAENCRASRLQSWQSVISLCTAGILLLPSSQGLPYLSMRGKRQRVGHIYWENLF